MNRRQNNRRSGGIILCMKHILFENSKTVKTGSDAVISKKINKNYLGTRKDLIVSSVYIPPYNSRYAKIEYFEDIENIVLDNGSDENYYLFCGDFNSHTGVKPDICALDDPVCEEAGIDYSTKHELDITGEMKDLGIPLKRDSADVSRDNGKFGHRLLEVCQNNALCIFNGRIGEDFMLGKETTNQGSVIDYVIGSPYLASKTERFRVHDFDPLYSDKHCNKHHVGD